MTNGYLMGDVHFGKSLDSPIGLFKTATNERSRAAHPKNKCGLYSGLALGRCRRSTLVTSTRVAHAEVLREAFVGPFGAPVQHAPSIRHHCGAAS